MGVTVSLTDKSLCATGQNKQWAKKIPTVRDKVFAPMWARDLGVEFKITESVWQSVHDRKRRLKLANFVSSNSDADDRRRHQKIENGSLVDDVTPYDSATTVSQAVEAIRHTPPYLRLQLL